MRVESVVMHQSRCLEPEVKVARSLVTEMVFRHLERLKLIYACINLHVQICIHKCDSIKNVLLQGPTSLRRRRNQTPVSNYPGFDYVCDAG